VKEALMTPDEALLALEEGNRRFAGGRPAGLRRDAERRREIASGQRPFAAVLACSDSRVAPEIIFDQGLGDLFIVRVAGNVADGVALESLELGTDRLEVPLIVVLGHTRCGAITAALASESGGALGETLLRLLQPAVDAARREETETDRIIDRAARENVKLIVRDLLRSPGPLVPLHDRGILRIVGALYDIDTGIVEWAEG
jgi:carbonic anhydrase